MNSVIVGGGSTGGSLSAMAVLFDTHSPIVRDWGEQVSAPVWEDSGALVVTHSST